MFRYYLMVLLGLSLLFRRCSTPENPDGGSKKEKKIHRKSTVVAHLELSVTGSSAAWIFASAARVRVCNLQCKNKKYHLFPNIFGIIKGVCFLYFV
jgi:hypothetical protein